MLCSAWIAVSLFGGACDRDSADMIAVGNVDSSILQVEPGGPVDVGFSDTISFEVELLATTGAPLSGVPVEAAFLDQSQNATLSPSRFFTDDAGRGTVVFTAPSPTTEDKMSFDIRFRSPDSEQRVSVTVDPALVSVIVKVDYDGKRDISSLETVLYLTDAEDSPRIETATMEAKAILPYELVFPGLLRDQIYEVEVNGRNTADAIRAAGRLTEVVPNTKGLSLLLTDTHLDLVGQYDARAEIVTDGALDRAVDALLYSPDFVEHPEIAVLDGIEAALTDDPFAQESFIAERETLALDTVLAEHFTDVRVDTAGAFGAVRADMVRSLAHLAADGAVESGRGASEGAVVAYHSVSQLTFGIDSASPGPVFLPSPVNTAECEAVYAENDTLSLSAHAVTMGLGDPLFFLYADVCVDIFGVSDTSRVFQFLVDCEATAAFLAPYLKDVTVVSVIEQGCLSACQTAAETMVAASTELNRTNLLSFDKATFILKIPDTGGQIPGFSTENQGVTWHADGETGSPMTATFIAGEVTSK